MAEEEGASGEEEERPGVMEVPGLEPRPSAERWGPRLSGLRLPHPDREDGRTKLTGAVRVKHNTQAEAGQGTSDCSPFSSRARRPTPGGPTRVGRVARPGGQGGPPCPGRLQLEGGAVRGGAAAGARPAAGSAGLAAHRRLPVLVPGGYF